MYDVHNDRGVPPSFSIPKLQDEFRINLELFSYIKSNL